MNSLENIDLHEGDNVFDYVKGVLPILDNKKKAKKKTAPEYDAEEQEIRSLHEEIRGTIRTTIPKARRIGELLIKRKAELGHGNYQPWLKRIKLPFTTAQTYMRVARSPKSTDAAHSTIDGLVKAVREGKRAERAEERRNAAGTPAPTSFDSGIITGDSLDWLRSQPSDSVPFFVCDPPYGLGLNYDGWTEPSEAKSYWEWFSPYWSEMTRVLQPGGNIIMWQSYTHMRHYWEWYPNSKMFAYGFYIRGFLMWEPIVFWTKEGKPLKRHRGCNSWLTVTQHKRHKTRLPDHPCPKPLADCREVVKRHTLPDTLVVDPFCGIGSIPLACALEGRKYLGIERAAHYAQLARDRLLNYKEENSLEESSLKLRA